MASGSWHNRVGPLPGALLLALPLLLIALLFSVRSSPFSSSISLPRIPAHPSAERGRSIIWSARRVVEWRPCNWWSAKTSIALPAKSNGYIRVDCYGGLNQMRRDFCDGVGIARLLNATLILPKFEVAAYGMNRVDLQMFLMWISFVKQTEGFVNIVRELPEDVTSREPFKVDCSKRNGNFDYIESVLPALLIHRFISITPAMAQRRDRYPLYAKAALCQACYRALRLNKDLEAKSLPCF
ncbi:hypothetical protein HPP92_025016 [Vanilla planifolia]|uniref:O-fucosyltransferase family protein n=1 Tax=Vanilla planifolia TaxID=51239 RepID=A0A835U9T4_VANPL|nr:hypothetical protein HPP92_025016 [Vanilla planifolia]